MNFIDQYTEYCQDFTDAPIVFHHRLALIILSTITNTKIWLSHGDKKLYPNLWLLILAPSSFYRKSYSLGIAERMITEISPDLILPSDFSREGLIDMLSHQPQGLLCSYEFASLAGVLNRDYMSGTKGFLTEIYDTPGIYRRRLKSAPKKINHPGTLQGNNEDLTIKIENPFLNIVSCSTIEWLCDSLKNRESDISGGFMARFFPVMAYPKTKVIPWQPPDNKEKREKLLLLLWKIKEINGEISFSSAAIEEYSNWYKSFEEKLRDNTSLMAPFYPRLAEYARKFAILSAVNRFSMSITVEDIVFGCKLATNASEEISELISPRMIFNNYDKQRARVEQFFLSTNGEKIPRGELCRALRIRSKILDEIMNDLLLSDFIETGPGEKTGERGTRKIVCYWKTPES